MRPLFICTAIGFTVTSAFYSRLISAIVTDNSGDTADTLELVFDDRGNAIAAPGEGTVLTPKYGYVETGVSALGQFKVTKLKPSGGEDGETLTVTAEAADFREALKERQTEHFEDTTLGAMLEGVFGRAGIEIEVDAELASKPIEYEARFNQSAVDFATRLATRYGAVAKPGGGKYVFVKKGAAANAAGAALSSIIIPKSAADDWDFEIEPRPRHGRVAAKWFDRAKGKTVFEIEKTGLEGPLMVLPHVFKSADEAKEAAKSAGVDANRKTGSGTVTIEGTPAATAEADVYLTTGWRPEVAGKWRAKTVTHTFDEGGYTTQVAVEAPEEQKKGGS